jgi:hypothetical protein
MEFQGQQTQRGKIHQEGKKKEDLFTNSVVYLLFDADYTELENTVNIIFELFISNSKYLSRTTIHLFFSSYSHQPTFELHILVLKAT